MTDSVDRNVSELSQKLLEGCKLLSDSCPETNVPLVSTPDGRMFSVGNGCYYVKEGDVLRKEAPAASALPATPGSPPRAGTAGGIDATTADGTSLSSKVAAKLLDGYTLLSESCPVTSVPLVQDAQGRILSVGTGLWYERTGGQLVEARNGITATSAPPPHPGPPSDAMLMPPPPPRPPMTPASAAPPPVTPSSASAAVASAVLSSTSANGVASRMVATGGSMTALGAAEAVAVLNGRLSEATVALADAPLREAPQYVTMIKDIALAIAALKGLAV